MWNLYKTIYLILMLPLLTLSCQKNQEKVDEKTVLNEFAITEGNLVGSWKDSSPAALDFTLFEDGTAKSDNMGTLLYKKWYLEGNTLYLIAKSVGNKNWSMDTTDYNIEHLDANQIKLKDKNRILKYNRIIKTQNTAQNEKDAAISEEKVKTLKGKLTFGHEVSSFQPCGSDKMFWISGETTDLKLLYDELTVGEKPYTPIYAEIKFIDKGKLNEGFPADYESVYEVVAILKTEKVSDNICK